MSKRKKSYAEMDTAELAEATRDLDGEVVGVRGRPLTAAEKKTHRDAAKSAKRKRGRPLQGAGAQVVAASIERGLLKEADAYAKRNKLGRSQLFTEALRALLAKAG